MPETYVPGVSYLKPRGPSVSGLVPPAAVGKGGQGVVGRVQTESSRLVDYFKQLISNVDRNTVVIGVTLATTLSLGGLTAWYYYKKRRETKLLEKASKGKVSFSIDETSSTPVKIKAISESSDHLDDAGNPKVLVLHQCPRGRKTPCIAPYPLKLETFLRVHGINYEVDFSGSEPRSQGTPWITLDLEDISDSQNCLQYIVEKYGVDEEKDFSDQEKSIARAYNHLLEHHLYWGIALWRWVYDGARSLGDIQLLPKKTVEVVPDVCRTVEQAAWFHGLGKKAPKDVMAAIDEDLNSLSEYLGEHKFFMRTEKATELDCTAFAMLSQMVWNMDGSPFHNAVSEKYKNLSDFCWRMRARYWPDWDSCLNNNTVAED